MHGLLHGYPKMPPTVLLEHEPESHLPTICANQGQPVDAQCHHQVWKVGSFRGPLLIFQSPKQNSLGPIDRVYSDATVHYGGMHRGARGSGSM
jgi:hypothetical protein